MVFIRKFYDVAEAEISGGGNDTDTLVQPSIAQMLAKHGTKNSSQDLVAPPIQIQRTPDQKITETKEEPGKAEIVTPAATANEQNNAEQAKPESHLQEKEESKAEEQKISEPAQQNQPSLQEVLKSQQPDTVLKELGFDDTKVKFIQRVKDLDPTMVAFLDKWENKEDLRGYLKELTTDYSKMSAEEVMRHQLRVEYPKASEAALNALFKKEIIGAYNLNSEDEDEVAEGRLLLDAKAENYRDKLIANQQKFLLPDPPEAKANEPDLQAQKAQQEIEAYTQQVSNDPYIKEIENSKSITIGEGDEKFSFPIDVSQLKAVLTDNSKWFETQFDVVKNSDGSIKSATPKIRIQALTAAFALDPDKFLNDYATKLKAIGGKKAIEPIHNAKPPENTTISNGQAKPATAAEAMAKQGKVNMGGMQT